MAQLCIWLLCMHTPIYIHTYIHIYVLAGAYIDARGGQFNGTALHMAAEGGHVHTVQLLIGEGADVNIRDKQTRLPYLLSRDKVCVYMCLYVCVYIYVYICMCARSAVAHRRRG